MPGIILHCNYYEHQRTWHIYNAGKMLYRDLHCDFTGIREILNAVNNSVDQALVPFIGTERCPQL